MAAKPRCPKIGGFFFPQKDNERVHHGVCSERSDCSWFFSLRRPSLPTAVPSVHHVLSCWSWTEPQIRCQCGHWLAKFHKTRSLSSYMRFHRRFVLQILTYIRKLSSSVLALVVAYACLWVVRWALPAFQRQVTNSRRQNHLYRRRKNQLCSKWL